MKLSQAFSSQHGADYKPQRPHVLADKTNSRHLQQTYITRSKWAGGPYSQNPWADHKLCAEIFSVFVNQVTRKPTFLTRLLHKLHSTMTLAFVNNQL